MLHCLDVGMLEVLGNNGDISEMDPETLQKSRSAIVTRLRRLHFVFQKTGYLFLFVHAGPSNSSQNYR